ncbi:MAG: alpha/beta hydrolase [Clostridia bacterium]|nr:alpha/beta hydrolase [Clostridia bacterium]
MENIKLWENGTPYYDESFGQSETYLTPHIVPETLDENGNVKKTGAVIVCAGGGYEFRADHEGNPVARFFNQYGISSFNLAYRFAPYNYYAIRADINRAVRWVRYNADKYNIDPEKIAVLGFSAGGHLATMGVTQYDRGLDDGDEVDRTSCRPDAGILCYPVVTLESDYTHRGSRNNLLDGIEEPLYSELIHKLSGQNAVTEDTPPIFLYHNADDECVPVENSINMATALSAKKIPFEFHVFEKGEHGGGLYDWLEGTRQWPHLAANWLKRLGY